MRKIVLAVVIVVLVVLSTACSGNQEETAENPSKTPEFSHDQAMSFERNYWENYLLMRRVTETIKRDFKPIELEHADFESISSKFSTAFSYLEKSKQTFKESNTFEGIRFDSYKLLEDYCQANIEICILVLDYLANNNENETIDIEELLKTSAEFEDEIFTARMTILSYTELTESGLGGFVDAGNADIEDIITLVNFEPIQLSNGNYTAGKDFPSGVYNIYAVRGKGNVSSDNMFDGGINAIMGRPDEDDFTKDLYQEEYKNIVFPEGCKLSISGGVEIRIVLIDLY